MPIGVLTAVTLASACAVTVSAQTPADTKIDLAPNRAGAPSTLRVDVDGTATDSDSRTPKSLALDVQRGFKVDVRSRAGRCTDAQAKDLNCPADSRIGKGEAVVSATFLGTSQDYTATLGIFLARAKVAGDLAAVVVTISEPKTGTRRAVTGRLRRLASGPFGHQLAVEGLDSAQSQVPAGVTIKLKRLTLTAGASRRVVETRTVKGKRVRRTVTRHLITNPPTCSGTWRALTTSTFADGTKLERELRSACTKRG